MDSVGIAGLSNSATCFGLSTFRPVSANSAAGSVGFGVATVAGTEGGWGGAGGVMGRAADAAGPGTTFSVLVSRVSLPSRYGVSLVLSEGLLGLAATVELAE